MLPGIHPFELMLTSVPDDRILVRTEQLNFNGILTLSGTILEMTDIMIERSLGY
jgi:hypothetical protein